MGAWRNFNRPKESALMPSFFVGAMRHSAYKHMRGNRR